MISTVYLPDARCGASSGPSDKGVASESGPTTAVRLPLVKGPGVPQRDIFFSGHRRLCRSLPG
ncbi:hypothetical protein [Actinomadura sp. B10D3]|uniref:hypothetical protein n=1 Tax=Actinomadura sp. B10D3 TaxID=3153557 RepID=UPI00325ED5BB